MSYGRFGQIVDSAVDPWASTTDTVQAYYHIQSESQSAGSGYPDIIAPAAANYPESGAATRYFGEVRHRVDVSDLGASRPAVVEDETTATVLTRVTAAPAANQYRLSVANSVRRSVIEFHSGQAGHTISYDFYSIGSVMDEGMGEMFNKIEYETYTTTANYTITDIDGYRNILCSTQNVGDITITLPTVADNENRVIKIYKDHNNGKVTVDGEGAEQIEANTSEYLFSAWDYITVKSDGVQWIIDSMFSSINSGWVSRADWTNVHIGTVDLDYDSSSGTFIDGEVITGTTSSDSGIIHNSSSVTFTLRNCITNGTVFSNNEIITGSISSATALVNEGSGTAKNLDSNFYHGTGLNQNEFKLDFFYDADANDTDSYKIFLVAVGQAYGTVIWQIDTNNIKLQTSTSAAGIILSDAGVENLIDADDGYYKIIWERKK